MIRWLSTAQAAKRLYLSQGMVCYLIRTGKLPAVKAGSRYRVTEQAVDAYAARRTS